MNEFEMYRRIGKAYMDGFIAGVEGRYISLRVGGCERARTRTHARIGSPKRHIKEAERDE